MQTKGSDATKSDGLSVKVIGGFGSVDLSDGDGYADDFETSADVAADEAVSAPSIPFDGDSKISADGGGNANITYLSPKISGLQFSGGYGNAGSDSKANKTAFGLGYSGGTMARSYKIKYAVSNTSGNGSAASEKVSASSLGVVLGTERIGLTIARNTQKFDDNSADYKGLGLGLTYKATSSLKLAIHRKTADDKKNKKYEYGETALSGVYTIAPGLTTSLTFTDWELTNAGGGKGDGTYTRLELKVDF